MNKIYQKSFFGGKTAGFTLIELLVVVLIIGILAAVAVPKYELAVDKSRYMQAIVFGNKVKEAEERYFMANGTYTEDFDNLDITLDGFSVSNPGELRKGDWRISVKEINNFVQGGVVVVSYLPAAAAYVIYMDRRTSNAGERQCRATAKTERAKKVCISLGGVFKLETDSNGTIYTLP